MRKILSMVVIGLILGVLISCNKTSSSGSSQAQAEQFPNRPITYVISWAPGGASDITARLLAAEAEKILGVPVVPENKPGGGAWIGWNALLQADADGYTVAQCALPTLVSGYLNPENKRSNTIADFAPLVNVARDYSAIAIQPNESRFTNIREFVEYAKTHEVTVGCGSPNSDDHIFVLKMNNMLNIKLLPVFSQGAADSFTSLMGGHVDAAMLNVGESVVPAKNGQIKSIAIASGSRVSQLPDVPTVKEALGVEVINDSSRGVLTKAGVPQDRLDILIRAFTQAAQTDTFKKNMAEQGLDVEILAGNDYWKLLQESEAEVKALAPILGWN
jgi:tripartite-type tricarboxylate transporter receptor subunit TctC